MSQYTLAINAFKDPRAGSLFHSQAFFALHDDKSGRYYEWLDAAEASVASIHFGQSESGQWRSPLRGTYAGFDFADDLPFEALAQFLEAVEADLKTQGAQNIEILLAPAAHNPGQFSRICYLLGMRGCAVSRSDLNYTIDVTSASLQARMRDTQLQRLKKCVRDGFTTGPRPLDQLPALHSLIAANAAAKGFGLSMTAAQIQTMADAIPGSVALFSVEKDAEPISAAICVRLKPDLLYIFLVGDAEGYQSHSPVVMLIDGIYAWCQTHNITLLDYGISTMGNDPNTGLMDFKRRLGFAECLKLRMAKKL